MKSQDQTRLAHIFLIQLLIFCPSIFISFTRLKTTKMFPELFRCTAVKPRVSVRYLNDSLILILSCIVCKTHLSSVSPNDKIYLLAQDHTVTGNCL